MIETDSSPVMVAIQRKRVEDDSGDDRRTMPLFPSIIRVIKTAFFMNASHQAFVWTLSKAGVAVY
jgi:hypothetical protein